MFINPRSSLSAARLVCRLRAFTLIELLTVIAIIGILAAILIPTIGKVRSTAQGARCVSNLRQIGQQILAYTNDNRSKLPQLNAQTDSACTDPRVISADGKQMAYHLWPYYSKIPFPSPMTASNVPVHRMFICGALEADFNSRTTFPSGSGDKSANSAQSYIINDLYRTLNGGRTVFGYYTGGASYSVVNIEAQLKLPNESASISRIWTLQDGDKTLTGRAAQATWLADKPAHGSSRNRLYLDAHVRKLNLTESDEI